MATARVKALTRRVSIGVGGDGARVIQVSYGLVVLGDSTAWWIHRVAAGKAQSDNRNLSVAHDMRSFIAYGGQEPLSRLSLAWHNRMISAAGGEVGR
jgi:hypothetical protein